MTQVVRKSVLPFYGVAAVWLVYALFFQLYRLSDFLAAGLVSLIVFFLLRAVCKDVVEEVKPQEKKEEKEKPTGNPQLDKMIADGKKALSELRRLDENIEDEKISASIRRMEEACEKIFQQVKQEPEKLPQIRKFMDYYLPTALKILNAYDRMGSLGVEGENISGTMQRVENMMDTIVKAFEKQLDALFGSEALDISTDITVLENMMAREGLTDQPLQAQDSRDSAGGSGITLEQ